MYLKSNIRHLRRLVRLKQSDLGEQIGKTKEVISAYERGINTPPLEVLIELCRVFEVNLDELVFANLEKEGLPQTINPEPKDETLVQMNQLMAQRIKELEREIRRHNPELAEELGIE